MSNNTVCLIIIGRMQYGQHKSDSPDYTDRSLNVLGEIVTNLGGVRLTR